MAKTWTLLHFKYMQIMEVLLKQRVPEHIQVKGPHPYYTGSPD